MRFLDPRTAGVAFLTRTVVWQNGELRGLPRLQPLRVTPGTQLMAVVRLESRGPLPSVELVASEVIGGASLPGVSALQIDFDARESERAWYASLLQRVRAGLPKAMPLTITALASWCEGDPWIATLPVDDAVPMLFRMGAGEFWNGEKFRPKMCRSSVGVSLDEPRDQLPRGRRVFVFNPSPWTQRAYQDAVNLARRWR